MSNKDNNKQDEETGKPWYYYGHAWLVFGGPAAVVVASLITVYIAVKERDPMIDDYQQQNSIKLSQPLAKDDTQTTIEERNALAPAVKARNHAATGVNDH